MSPYNIVGGSMPSHLSLIPREDLYGDFPVWFVGSDARYCIEVQGGMSEKKLVVCLDVFEGDCTDLASVPKLSLIQPVRFARPAVLHDIGYRYSVKRLVNDGRLSVFCDEEELGKDSAKFIEAIERIRENQKDFFDRVLRFFCERDCKSLASTAPARIYYAVKFFGGGSFLNPVNRTRMENFSQMYSPPPC